MALTSLNPNLLGTDSAGASKLSTAGGLVQLHATGVFTIANTSANTLFVSNTGTVGIGTGSPATTLTVIAPTNAGIAVNDGTVNSILYNSTDGRSSIGTTTAHPVDFYSNNSVKATVAANGNVGIGTSTPSSKLHITGGQQYITGAASTGAYTRWYNNAQTTGDLQVGQGWSTGSDNIGFILNNSNADLLLCTNGIDRMRVAANGFVGIGTTGPTETLTSVGRRGMSKPADTTRRTIEFHTVISASTSNADLYQVDISNLNQSFYYEIIINGSDWSGHSAARAIKRGFHCPNGSYSPHSVVESSGTYGSNIIYDYGQSSNIFTGKLRLDEGTVSLHCYVRLIGRINSYTVYGTE